VGITLRIPDIAIPGADYQDGPAEGLDKLDPRVNIDSDYKKEDSNLYYTRTLVNPSLVAYIKPGRGTS
jgi:hypothetical protein